jgi:hypothetical protein
MIMASTKYGYEYHDKKDDKKDDDDYGHHHDKKKHKVVAENDKYYLDEDTTFTGNVSTNDYDTKKHDLDFKVIKGPANGTLDLNMETGAFTYTPNANWFGTDYFKYKAYDEKGKWDWAVVKLHVRDVAENTAPVCKDDFYKVKETKKLYGDVSDNDTDADGDTLTYALVGTAPEGLTFNADGSFVFKPEKDKDRKDEKVTFEYKVTDEAGASDTCHATIYVKDNWGKKKHDDKYDHKDDDKYDHKDDHKYDHKDKVYDSYDLMM